MRTRTVVDPGLATQAYDLTLAQLNSSRLVMHSAHLIGARLRSPLLTLALAIEPAHRPRPFGCGLRVTVIAASEAALSPVLERSEE